MMMTHAASALTHTSYRLLPVQRGGKEVAFKWLFKKSYLKATSISHFEVAFSGTGNKVGFERDFKVALFRSGFEVDL